MELLGSGLLASVERGGNRDKLEKERGIGEEGTLFLFALCFLSPSQGFFSPALQAIEFTQYSFTVHNKVVVTENLGSVLQFHLKDIAKSSGVYS